MKESTLRMLDTDQPEEDGEFTQALNMENNRIKSL